MRKPIAIACSDLHLSMKPPLCRMEEPDWFEAMARPLLELRKLQQELDVPVLCAGDIFDKWNSPPELINFAMQHLPEDFYAIPGQHDLPNHSTENLHRSAYQTLEYADSIGHIAQTEATQVEDDGLLEVYGSPYGTSIHKPTGKRSKYQTRILVAHQYVWDKGSQYDVATPETHISRFKDVLKNYDFAIFGDNHKGFTGELGECLIINCGGFSRRKSDEVNHKPRVWILYDDISVVSHYLNTSGERLAGTEINLPKGSVWDEKRFDSMLKEMETLGGDILNFTEGLREVMRSRDLSQQVKDIIIETMGG